MLRNKKVLPLIFFKDHVTITPLIEALVNLRRQVRHWIKIKLDRTVLTDKKLESVLPTVHQNADLRKFTVRNRIYHGHIHSFCKLAQRRPYVHPKQQTNLGESFPHIARTSIE